MNLKYFAEYSQLSHSYFIAKGLLPNDYLLIRELL